MIKRAACPNLSCPQGEEIRYFDFKVIQMGML
jgi:hypothetical protein